MLSVYNEADIVEEVIENLLSHDLALTVLDNGSNDGSYEICRKFADRGDIELDRWTPQGLDLQELTIRLFKSAAKHSPDWLVFCDADEILETPAKSGTLRGAIEAAEASGCNLIQFDRYDFFMTDADDLSIFSPTQRLNFYSWQGDCNYRAFKNVQGVQGVPSFAHLPQFPPQCRYKIASEKLVLRHYPYRSREHALSKIDNIVSKIGQDTGERKGWQRRYLRLASEGHYSQPTDHRKLNRVNKERAWDTTCVHSPFVDRQRTREQLFTADGYLRLRMAPTVNWEFD